MDAGSELMHPQASSAAGRRQRSVLRAALVGLLSLCLGLLAHAVSGGALPGAPILVALAALAVLVATLVAQVRLPVWGVLVALGAAQQVLHWVLGGLGGGPSSSFLGSSLGHHAEVEVPAGEAAVPGHSPEMMLMLHAHLAAALLAGWAVVRFPVIRAWSTRLVPRLAHGLLGR
ncbi:hypothetical protein [Arthrobacter sp. RIT-PI-e]|uniref:hypothetical protein n=1 Tax=Arthrobacter sp. RIT-PI-e TaxID=1681197 RepID=UPI0006769E2A|nr:hypothetical protein [Arthrobacter sp. RIT-PI-e]